LTDELIHQEEWFPISLAPDRTYEVSHIDSPILEDGSRIALMLSLVPSAEPMSGAAVMKPSYGLTPGWAVTITPARGHPDPKSPGACNLPEIP